MLTQLYYIAGDEFDAYVIAEDLQSAVDCWKAQLLNEPEQLNITPQMLKEVGDPEEIHILTSTSPLLFTQPVFRMTDFSGNVDTDAVEQIGG